MNVFLCFLLQHFHDVIGRDDAEHAAIVIDDRRRNEVIALKLQRDLFLIFLRRNLVNFRVGDIVNGHRAPGSEQPVERHAADQMVGGIDDPYLREVSRQVVFIAHIINRLPDRPERRDGDIVALHKPPGRVVWKLQRTLQGCPLAFCQFRENIALFALLQVLQQINRIIGVQLADRFSNLFVGKSFQNLVTNRLFQLAQSPGAEILAQSFDQLRALLSPQMFNEVGKIGVMYRAGKRANLLVLVLLKGKLHRTHKLRQQGAFSVTQLDFFGRILHRLIPCLACRAGYG